VKRPALPKEEELTEDGILNCYADNTGSVGSVCEFGLEIPTRISDGESSQIGGDAKIDPYVFPMNEQASGDVSATFICSHDGFPVMSSSFSHDGFPVMPSSWKGNAKGFHGYRGRWFGLDAQCSESLDFQLSKDHGSNSSGLRNMGRTQKRNLRKKIRTGLQKREKVSRHVAGKKLDADVVGQYQQSEGALWFSYGVGIGVMFMHESRKCEIDKLTSLLNQTVGMVQELRKQLDERRDYLQNSEIPKACHGEIYTYQQENLGAAANWMLEKDPESVCSSFKDNESAFIIDEPAQQVTGMVELEAELQVRLEYIQMDFLQSNSKHQREKTEYSESTDSSDVVDERLYANGLLGQWSSANKNPFVPSEVFHADDYGVSPYEFDRRLCDLLEKQQEETISELEVELKSTEIELHARERELQHWKEHVRHLVEFSFGTDSGDESASLESVS
jgi:hypothetical protein